MSWIGDIRLDATFDTKFCTVTTTGAPTTLAGSPVISAYVGNSTTQLTAGITLSVDFDSVTGLNNVRVVATSANGYATASNYQLVITTGTVGGTSVVGYVVAQFSIEARSALMPTTAARTLDVSAGGEAGVDWANVGSPTTALNLSATNIDVDQIVASVSGAVGSVTGAVGSVTGAVGSVTGAVGSVTGAVGSVAAGGITAASIATGAIDADAIAADAVTEIQAGLATPTNITAGTITTVTNLTNAATSGDLTATMKASVNTEADTALTDYGALKPTVAARTLDVSATGEAGLDWANIGSPTTANNLSATNIDVDQIVASVSGAVGSVTGAVGSVTGAVGSVTGAVGSVTGAVGSVAAGGITAASIATGAIDADAIAADAVTEIQAGLATPTNITAGTITTVTNLTNAATSGDLTATMKTSVNTEADTALTDYGALKPTVAARTLDVSAGGEAGLDWANIGSPTTAQNLSATNIDVDQIVASVSGAVGSVTGAVGSVTGLTASNLDATISSRATPAQVNTEVLDVLVTDTFAEPSAPPAATASLKDKIGWQAILARNKITQTSTTQLVKADDTTTTVGTSTVSDDGSTATRGEFA